MTRSEAIATINKHLEAADDELLEAVATNLEGNPLPTMTVGEALETFPSDSVLPRPLTAKELALIEQAKEDFRLGRTHTLEESETILVAELARRRRLRAAL